MKKFLTIALALLFVLSFAACGGDKFANLQLNVNGFGQNIINASKFSFTPDVLEDGATAASNLKLSTDQLNTVDGKPEIFYAVVAGYPEAVFVIGAKDAAAAKAISNGPVKDWIAEQRAGYSDYGPDQVPKLDSAINRVAGRYVICVVTDDNASAKTAIDGLLDSALQFNGK